MQVDDVDPAIGEAAGDPVDVAGAVVSQDGEDEAIAAGDGVDVAVFIGEDGDLEVEPLAVRDDRVSQGLRVLGRLEFGGEDDREVAEEDRLAQLLDVPPVLRDRPGHRVDDPDPVGGGDGHDRGVHAGPGPGRGGGVRGRG